MINNEENQINKLFKGKWYVINSYSGHEEKVKNDLIQRINSCEIKDYIFDVRIVKGKIINKKTKKTIEKNLYPGYIFVNVIMNDEAWFVIRNTPGVTGFIGSSGKGVKPLPLTNEEAIKMLKINYNLDDDKKEVYTADFKEGSYVKIISGLFKNEEGKVISMDYSKGLATIEIEIFGRFTPTKIKFSSCKKMN